jgi:hypothetical protein
MGPVDSTLADLLIVAENPYGRRDAEKALSKSQDGIATILQSGERVQAIAQMDSFSSELLLVTNLRLLRVKKGKESGAPVPLREVAETSIRPIDRRDRRGLHYLVVVETHTSKQYAEHDQRRFHPDHFFMVEFNGPRDAQALCGIVDMLMERTSRPMAASPLAPEPTVDDPMTHLEKLAELRDKGILTDEEFSAKKAEILRRV